MIKVYYRKFSIDEKLRVKYYYDSDYLKAYRFIVYLKTNKNKDMLESWDCDDGFIYDRIIKKLNYTKGV